jgi:hypothetical protein
MKIEKMYLICDIYGFNESFMHIGYKAIVSNYFKFGTINKIILHEWRSEEIKNGCSPKDKVFISINEKFQ